jgi:hypothetical protein
MAIREREIGRQAPPRLQQEEPNGPAMAAFLGAGIGVFTLGLIVVLGEMGLLRVPALYAPAGGVTGRTTLAILVWLVAWAILHARWRKREVDAGRVGSYVIVLTALGIVGTFPPFWGILP